MEGTMTNYIPADQIRAKIEQLRGEYTDIAIDSHYGTVNANHVVADLEQLLSLLDILPESAKRGYKDCNGCEYNRTVKDQIGWQFRGCFGGEYKGKPISEIELCPLKVATLPEQPVEGLEEEIKKWIDGGDITDTRYDDYDDGDIERTARHFAEWGEKNAYKAIMKKADEVRDKRFDTDYEVKIEPAAGFDFGCVNVYHEGKLVGQYVEPKEEKKLPDDLEEAADEYTSDSTGFIDMTAYNAFIAGAEYQRKQDQQLIELAEDHAMLAGMNKMKEEMMEKAVETEVVFRVTGHGLLPAVTFLVDDSYKEGDKVKIIIIPEENLNAIQNEN